MSIEKAHVWVSGLKEKDGALTYGAIIERAGQRSKELWFRVPVEKSAAVTTHSDPFVLATLFLAMRGATDLVIHGEVSPSLLRNLDEFQAVWACWLPDQYTRIEIVADSEREPSGEPPEFAVAAFSGGVDSSFTVFRHRKARCGRLRHDLRGAIMVHGFDIPLSQADTFERAAKRVADTLASIGVEFIPVATNFRELPLDWTHCFAAAAAACLSLFQAGYRVGLLGSSEPYSSLLFPWGSNPVTDHLLSSESFRIVHDGAGFTRSEKVREIADWPEAMRFLRVCWQGERLDRNCGRCEKCIRTILNFRVNGLVPPESFDQDVQDEQLLQIRNLNSAQLAELRQILMAARRHSISASWVDALRKCVRRNELHRGLTSGIPGDIFRAVRNAVPWRLRSYMLRSM